MSPAALTLAGVAFVAVCGLAGTIGASWISKRAGDRQRAAQNAIDERKVDREEFDSLTRELRSSLTDVRAELATEREARRAAEQRAERAEQRIDRIATTLAAHGQWDLLVLAEVRRSNTDFPDPPPLVDIKSP